MEIFKVDLKLLEKQIKAVLESNIQEDLKEGIHNLLGDILDYTEENKTITLEEFEKMEKKNKTEKLCEIFFVRRFGKEKLEFDKKTGYYYEWLNRFKSGHPESSMDDISLKIYKEILEKK